MAGEAGNAVTEAPTASVVRAEAMSFFFMVVPFVGWWWVSAGSGGSSPASAYVARRTEVTECAGSPSSASRLTSMAEYAATRDSGISKVATRPGVTCPSGSILLVRGSKSHA